MKKLISVIAAAMMLSSANVSAEMTTQRIVFDEKPSQYGYLAYNFVDENGNEIEPQYEDSISLFGLLPSYYRNENLTPVKNQGEEGCCWAFAMVGAIEASLIQQGYATPQNIDLSEAHMAYFGVNLRDNVYNDGDASVGVQAYSDGGNEYYALAAMSKGSGAVSEEVAPYEEYTGENLKEVEEEKRFLAEAGISKLIHLNPRSSDSIKRAIMEYGSVLNALYVGGDYYNSQNAAYHYAGNTTQNHQTLIVGWDDTYPKENFNAGHRPTSDGAWIVRNSWGSSFGDGGYMYVSYETTIRTFTAVEACLENEYDNNLGYTGGTTWNALEGIGIYGNVFTAKEDEVLEAISVNLLGAAELDIRIYTDVKTTPWSGKLTRSVIHQTTGAYEKITLDTPIVLSKGQKFSVVVKGGAVTFEGPDSVREISYNRGESYFYNGQWVDAGTKIILDGAEDVLGNFAIRAYTNNNKPKVTALTKDDLIIATSKYNDNAEIYIAQYDKNDVLVGINKSTEASLKKNTKKYKVFSWDSKMHTTTETAFVKGVN